ncbi:bifunctional diguanylate cyclase/phosphodiesterase [Magnetospira sp. QH-2]|uniref:putative bifunctional diguanylate cyclase/phosphodiesterase n=1 Tax=Magnetospira sp. (strain QH-2) TaxID=1288970 RepID=UPI0003E81A9C|nr:EAL domain-containing protein [Magnetospira sp. QH-2]CCQ74309.1 putative Diguanylate kinase [Magnetospira sp. QH-2]
MNTSPPINILLVEDNQADARLVELLLLEVGFPFQMRMAGTLAEGLAHLADVTWVTDIVLLDVRLPDCDGLDGIAHVLELNPNLPVVVLTGNDDESFAVKAVKKGAQDYLVKGQGDGVLMSRAIRYAIERKKAESKLHLAAAVFDAASEGILVVDMQDRVSTANPAFLELTGYSMDELAGQKPSFMRKDMNSPTLLNEINAKVDGRGSWAGEVTCEHKERGTFHAWVSVSAVRDPDGHRTDTVFVLRDITERKRAEDTIWHQANFDALTDLPNRTLFSDRLAEAITRARRTHKKVVVMFIDLDRFKWVNDTLGHHAGDELLKLAAARLVDATRASDTVARQGGDEFTIIVDEVDEARNAEIVARKILSELAEPFTVAGNEVFISGSIGLTVFPEDGDTVTDLLMNADTAMYQAKESGRNAYRFFTPEMNSDAFERITLEGDLRGAIENDSLSLWYQPVVDLTRNEIAHVEALMRWEHAERGMVSPALFVPLAEETGMISEIGLWALRAACTQIASWRATNFPPFRVAVNLSARQFHDPGFARKVLDILDETGADPTWLSLDLNEELMNGDTSQIEETLRQIREKGVQFSLDDFGTGYSSLSHLRRLAVDILKIDKSIVAGMTSDSGDATLVETIVAMGHSMGATIIAEGVETLEQLNLLTDQGCDLAQGFLFGRPVKAEELLDECARSLKQAAEVKPKPKPKT